MNLMPTTRALFGYDVIGSSQTDDDQLEEIRQEAYEFVEEAFEHTGVDLSGRANYSATGDGSLAAYPEHSLPALIDAAHFLHGQLYLHNKKYLPAVRLRLAVHTAPIRITEGDSFQRPMIELARLLDAAPLKEIVRRLNEERPVTVVAAVSDQAYRVAVRGGHTRRLLTHDFGELEIANKEFKETCRVWAPGLGSGKIRELTRPAPTKHPDHGTLPSTQGKQLINNGMQGMGDGMNTGTIVVNGFGGSRQ